MDNMSIYHNFINFILILLILSIIFYFINFILILKNLEFDFMYYWRDAVSLAVEQKRLKYFS